jgi:diguanylate cyclase (GGDEF)-like protein/PAS domain S-box-containing protein
LIPIDLVPLNVAIYHYEDGHFVFLNFNLQAEKTENIKREDIIGRKLEDVFPGVKEFGLLPVLERVYKTGKPEHFEAGYYHDEIREGWRINDVSRLDNGNIMAIYKDVTQEVKTAHTLEALGNLVRTSLNEVYIFNTKTLLFTYANDSALKNIGYTMDELLHITPVDIKPEYTNEKFREQIQPLLDGTSQLITIETKHCRKNGSLYDVEARIQKMNYAATEQFFVVAMDISDRIKDQQEMLKLHQAIEESELLFKTLTESALAGIFLFRETFIYINKAASDMIGYTLNDLKSIAPIDLIDLEDRGLFVKNFTSRLNGDLQGKTVYENLKIVTKSGEIRWFYIAIISVKYKGMMAGLGTAIDVTERKLMEKKLEYTAKTDMLTGLYNRLKFYDIIQREIALTIRHKTKLAIIYMDIDFFKRINDIHGHNMGDIVLKEVASIITDTLRSSDYPFRWGGEEFIIVCPSTSIGDVRALAERLRQRIEQKDFHFNETVTVSIGITQYHLSESIDNMIIRADKALYHAKENGRNQIIEDF